MSLGGPECLVSHLDLEQRFLGTNGCAQDRLKRQLSAIDILVISNARSPPPAGDEATPPSAFASEEIELVDITDDLVKLYDPSEKTLGHIREMRNVLERALLSCESGLIGPESIRFAPSPPFVASSLPQTNSIAAPR